MMSRKKKHGMPGMSDQEENTALMLRRYCAGGRVLDFPCGHGFLSRHLRDNGCDVSSADIDPAVFEPKDIPWTEADLDGILPFEDETFDAICCVAGLEHTESPYNTIRRFRRVLRPGGWLFVQYPNFSSLLRRIRFLSSGRLTKHSPRLIPDSEPKADHGHIACLSLEQARHVLATANFEVVHTHFFRFRHRTAFWGFPLWAPLKLSGWLSAGRKRREGLQDALHLAVLFNAEVVFVAKKR